MKNVQSAEKQMSSLAFQFLTEPPQNGNVNPIDSNQQPQINALHIVRKERPTELSLMTFP